MKKSMFSLAMVCFFAVGVTSTCDNACGGTNFCSVQQESNDPVVYSMGILRWTWKVRNYNVSSDLIYKVDGMCMAQAIKVFYYQKWSEFILYREDNELYDASQYVGITFLIKGLHDRGMGQIWLYLRGVGGYNNILGHVPVSEYIMDTGTLGDQLDPDKWYRIFVPLNKLNPKGELVKEVLFEGNDTSNGGAGVVYIDDLWWVSSIYYH